MSKKQIKNFDSKIENNTNKFSLDVNKSQKKKHANLRNNNSSRVNGTKINNHYVKYRNTNNTSNVSTNQKSKTTSKNIGSNNKLSEKKDIALVYQEENNVRKSIVKEEKSALLIKRRNIIAFLIIILIVIVIIGFSYAYFISQINVEKKDNSNTDIGTNGIVNVSLDVNEKITAKNIFPGYKMAKKITLKGSGKSTYKSVAATIIIKPNLGVFTGDIIWHLYKSNSEITCTSNLVVSSLGSYDNASCVIPEAATVVLEGDSQYKKYKVNVDYNTNDNYYLVVEYLNQDKDQSEQMNESFNIDVGLIKYDADNVIDEVNNDVKFSMTSPVAGITVASLGDNTYEINGTSTEMLNIRLSDYFKTSVMDANELYDSSNPNENVIMEKGHTYNISYEYVSGSNTMSKFNTFRLCFAIPNSYAGLQTFGYDFYSGFFGNERLVQDVGMYFLWIDKNINFNHFIFKIKITEVTGDDDTDNVVALKTLSYDGTSISVAWYDSGYIEVFGYNDLTNSNRKTTYINLNDHVISNTKSGFYQEKYVTSPPYKSGTNVKMTYQNYRNGPSIDKALDYNNQIYFQFVDTVSEATILSSPSLSTENNDLTSAEPVTVSGILEKDAISPLLIIGNSVNFEKPWKFKFDVDIIK